MSFNLRMATPSDGEHAWEYRKEAVAELIAAERPDVLGTQEGRPEMHDWLDPRLPGYRRFGVARGGRGEGEHSAVFLHESAGTVVDHGDFWLSDTPHVPGSRSFGNEVVRMATWVRFRAAGDGREWLACNTHLDHRSAPAREQGACLIRSTLQALAPDGPWVLTGDFNAPPDSPPIAFLTGRTTIDGERGDLKDTLVEAAEALHRSAGTFHGYQGIQAGQQRIDYIFVRGDVRVYHAAVLVEPVAGVLVSDHFPVTAVLKTPAPSAPSAPAAHPLHPGP